LLAFVAAEAREFAGFLENAERVVKLDWPLSFARVVWLNGRAGLLVANGPGPKLAGQALEVVREKKDLQRLNVNLELTGLASTGFCGALDPALEPCEIFVANQLFVIAESGKPLPNGHGSETRPRAEETRTRAETPARSISAIARFLPSRDRQGAVVSSFYECSPITTTHKYKSGNLLSMDHVASTASEKSERREIGADAVEMEAAAVAAKAKEWSLPFYAIRVVTDTATESFPLDFNRMRDADGRFDRAKIITAALRRPGAIFPPLLRLNKRCKSAAKALGEFIADSRI
jgi:nucleoside phosphorylase